MEFGRTQVCLVLVGALACLSVTADKKCDSYAKQIGPKVFDPLKTLISAQTNKVEFTSDTLFGPYLKVKNATITSFDFELYPMGNGSAADLCIDSGSAKSVSTLQAIFTDRLQAHFDRMDIFIPGLPPIGGANASLIYTIEGILMNVSVIREGDACKATLNSIKVLNLGRLSIEFGGDPSVFTVLVAFILKNVWFALKILSEPFFEDETFIDWLHRNALKLFDEVEGTACKLIPSTF